MKVKIQKALKKEKGLLIVPYFKGETKAPKYYNEELKSLLKKALDEKELSGKGGEKKYFTIDSKAMPGKVLFFGAGKSEKLTGARVRKLGADICMETRALKQNDVMILMSPELDIYARELIEGIALKDYRISKYKTGEDCELETKAEINNIILVSKKEGKTLEKEIEKALVVAQATNVTKDLVNGPANIIDIEYFESIAKQLKKDYGYKVTVIDKAELKKQGWGGLLAVNQGSYKPAKVITLEYNGAKNPKEKPIVLVGKGVVFDSGGYNLKPSAHMEDMHSDKAGASAIIGIFTALKDLKIKKNIVGVLVLTENMIDGNAFRPSDVITMLNGKTVEIKNTDAEGRLILADGVHYAQKKFKPECLIDIATLTGAAMVALGDRYTAMFTNDKEIGKRLLKAGDETDDLIWELPLHKDHIEKVKSKVADYCNADVGTSHLAGGSKGAAFVAVFVEKDMKWAHIDIAGTAYTHDPKKYEQKGATGIGVRFLLNFIENY